MAQTFQWLLVACLLGTACAQENLFIQEPFDCEEGAADWRDGWSEAKTAHCCKTTDACCESETENQVGADEAKAGSKCPAQMDSYGTFYRALGLVLTAYFAVTSIGLLFKSICDSCSAGEPQTVDGINQKWKDAQSPTTHAALLFGTYNFWFGVYAPVTVPLLGSMNAGQVFFVHFVLYMIPVGFANVLVFICARVLACVQPEREPVREVLKMNVGATNLMPREVEGRLRRSLLGGWELEDSAGLKIPLVNYSGGGEDGDIISAVVNYPTYVPTTVNPEFAAYRRTRVSTAGCVTLDKFILFLQTWTLVWAAQYLPKETCNPLGSSTVEQSDIDFFKNILQFFFILMDGLSVARFWAGCSFPRICPEGGGVEPTRPYVPTSVIEPTIDPTYPLPGNYDTSPSPGYYAATSGTRGTAGRNDQGPYY